jgi:hypothetical protein
LQWLFELSLARAFAVDGSLGMVFMAVGVSNAEQRISNSRQEKDDPIDYHTKRWYKPKI